METGFRHDARRVIPRKIIHWFVCRYGGAEDSALISRAISPAFH
jgi:hypothetical protein